MRRTAVPLVVLLVLAGPLAACAKDSASGPTSPATDAAAADLGPSVDLTGRAEVTIEIVDNAYNPRSFTVSEGTKVTFRNTGANAHNVVPNVDGAFAAIAAEQLQPGASASMTFPVGTTGFHCSLHGTATRGQRGAAVVTAGRGAPGATAPASPGATAPASPG